MLCSPDTFLSQHVFVTGASRGLGRSIAEAFARCGATVSIGFRARERDAENVVNAIRTAGGKATAYAIDVRSDESVQRVLEDIEKREGPVRVLVNNAAVVSDAPLAMMSPSDWTDVVDTALGGTFRCTRAVVRSMMAQRKGSVINMGSLAAERASPGQVNYSAAKAGIEGFTRSLARELGRFNIRINCVVPGLIEAGMAERLDRRLIDERRALIPLSRLGRADEVAAVVLFLASDAASYITGQSLVVDGGLGL